MNGNKPTIIVAGASGFIGQALGPTLGQSSTLIGLSRSNRKPSQGYSAFRTADLFSLKDCENALGGADYAIYLVHSMMPSAKLVQGSFSDLDLLCADNFARAAKKHGVKQIIYLGGLLPEGGELSEHLKSRAEVEKALGGTGIPITTLRAGLVVGARGSSFQMVVRLVRRLPIMLCPAWTQTRMQPVALEDVVSAIQLVCGQPKHYDATYDLGCPEIVTYRALLSATADAMGKRRRFLSVPFFSPSFSRLWVSLTTGAPKDLVGPLVKSLRHEMVARPSHKLPELEPVPLRTMLSNAIEEAARQDAAKQEEAPRAFRAAPKSAHVHTVRSVQRMRIPADTSAEWATKEYLNWLPIGLKGLIRVQLRPNNEIHFTLFKGGPKLLILALRIHRNEASRNVLRVVGGLLAKTTHRGRLEFRQILDEQTLLAGIHDFEPSLPWWIYRISQAQFHRYVMARFRTHLANLSSAK